MNKSLSKIKEQIEKLQKEAQLLQSGVIARLRREIAQHGITAEELFGKDVPAAPTSRPRTSAKARKAGVAKYADGNGNTWGGVGKRPQWIHAAIAAGRSLDEFLVNAEAKPATVAVSKAKAGRKRKAPQAVANADPKKSNSVAKPRAAGAKGARAAGKSKASSGQQARAKKSVSSRPAAAGTRSKVARSKSAPAAPASQSDGQSGA